MLRTEKDQFPTARLLFCGMKNLSTSSIFENCCRGDILISSFMVWRSDLYWFLRSAFSYMNKLVKKRGVALEVKKGGRDGNSGEGMKSHIFPCFFYKTVFFIAYHKMNLWYHLHRFWVCKSRALFYIQMYVTFFPSNPLASKYSQIVMVEFMGGGT